MVPGTASARTAEFRPTSYQSCGEESLHNLSMQSSLMNQVCRADWSVGLRVTMGSFAKNGPRHDFIGSLLHRLEPSMVQLVLSDPQIFGQFDVLLFDLRMQHQLTLG